MTLKVYFVIAQLVIYEQIGSNTGVEKTLT